jgi:hypothetical protein
MKNINDEKQLNDNNIKRLTIEELNLVSGFEEFSVNEQQMLIDLVYNLSLVLFKNFNSEQP